LPIALEKALSERAVAKIGELPMKLLFHALFVLLVLAPPAMAQAKPWPPGVHFQFVAGGHYKEWERPFPCPNGHLSMLVRVKNPQPVGEWVANASVSFRSDGDLAQVSLVAFDKDATKLSVYVKHVTDTERILARMERDRFPISQPVRLDIVWKVARTISVTIGNITLPEINLRKPAKKFQLAASGLEVAFDSMTLECGLIS
jgi:hypothetical protein